MSDNWFLRLNFLNEIFQKYRLQSHSYRAGQDFFIFPKTKRQLIGDFFASIEAVQAPETRALNGIPKKDFEQAFLNGKARYQKCASAKGSYFANY